MGCIESFNSIELLSVPLVLYRKPKKNCLKSGVGSRKQLNWVNWHYSGLKSVHLALSPAINEVFVCTIHLCVSAWGKKTPDRKYKHSF